MLEAISAKQSLDIVRFVTQISDPLGIQYVRSNMSDICMAEYTG